MISSTVGYIHRPPSVMTVAVRREHAVLVSCRGSLLQPDLLLSASPWTHTYSTLGLWWAVSHHKTKQYNQLRVGMHRGLLLLAVSLELSFHSLGLLILLSTVDIPPLLIRRHEDDDLAIMFRFTNVPKPLTELLVKSNTLLFLVMFVC